MLYNYKKYIQVLESKNFDKKVEKQKTKIREFLKSEPIIDFIFDKFVSEPREGARNIDSGLKYTIWLANVLKKDVLKELIKTAKISNNYGQTTIHTLIGFAPNVGNLNITDEKLKPYFEYFLTHGELSDKGKWGTFHGESIDLKEKINSRIEWQLSSGQHNDLIELKDWLKSPIREEKLNLKTLTLEDAIEKSKEWHKSLKASGIVTNEEGDVIMTFEDGWYWIDLKTTQCREEADAMGHCATTDADTLLSLRKAQSPHVTVAFNYAKEMDNYGNVMGGTILQMKGRNNERPKEKYHPYILQLLSAPNVKEGVKLFDNDPEFEYFPVVEFQLGEWETSKDFHLSDLNIKQLLHLSKNNKELFKDVDIGIKYSLVKAELLDKEEFVSGYDDLEIVDGEIHFLLKGFDEFDDDIYKENSEYQKDWQYKTLRGDGYEFYEIWEGKFDYDYNWNFTENALNEMIKYIDKNNIKIEFDLIDDETYEGTLKLSKNNMSIGKDGEIWIKIKEIDYMVKLSSLLENGDYENISSPDLNKLREKLDSAYIRSQSMANEDEAYNKITDAILNFTGPIVTPKDAKWYPDNKIHIKPNFENIGDIDLGDQNSIINILNYGLNNVDETGNKGIEVQIPYNGWYGSINKEDLSEELINILYE